MIYGSFGGMSSFVFPVRRPVEDQLRALWQERLFELIQVGCNYVRNRRNLGMNCPGRLLGSPTRSKPMACSRIRICPYCYARQHVVVMDSLLRAQDVWEQKWRRLTYWYTTRSEGKTGYPKVPGEIGHHMVRRRRVSIETELRQLASNKFDARATGNSYYQHVRLVLSKEKVPSCADYRAIPIGTFGFARVFSYLNRYCTELMSFPAASVAYWLDNVPLPQKYAATGALRIPIRTKSLEEAKHSTFVPFRKAKSGTAPVDEILRCFRKKYRHSDYVRNVLRVSQNVRIGCSRLGFRDNALPIALRRELYNFGNTDLPVLITPAGYLLGIPSRSVRRADFVRSGDEAVLSVGNKLFLPLHAVVSAGLKGQTLEQLLAVGETQNDPSEPF